MAARDVWSELLTSVDARSNRLWITPAIGTVVAVLVALLAANAGLVFDEESLPDIEEATLESMLTVISSSMLAVTTFSLSIMVSALANAASSATPRATELVMSDPVTHTAIASFLSAFVYSVIARTALGIGFYGPAGRWVLLVATVGVLVWLIATLIQWVRTLSSLGLVSNTLDKLEAQARSTLLAHRREPGIGARVASSTDDGTPLRPDDVGYLTLLRMEGIRDWAEEHGARVHITTRPGSFVHPGLPVARVTGSHEEETLADLRKCFRVEASRGYDQDPRYGLIALSEVGQRALSPAVNDPGTAIDALARMTRVIISAVPEEVGRPDPSDPVSIVALEDTDLLDAYEPIGRDGAGILEVGLRLQKNLAALAAHGDASLAGEAARQSTLALRRARRAGLLPEDIARLEAVADWAGSGSGS